MATLRIAIVGAGPSGLYAAEALAAAVADGSLDATIDVLDRLPVPFGLVRYGVAPDHASIRSVRDTLDAVLDAPCVQFLGGIEVGGEVGGEQGMVSAQDLRAAYDAVIWAYGAARDRRMGIAGEDARGSIAATDLVAWYTGHPDADRDVAAALAGCEQAVVVGAGNVAIDVVRILATPAPDLRVTDMPDAVLEGLGTTRLRRICLVARRGPAQAAFTTKELRELGEIPGARIRVDPADLEPIKGADAPDRATARNLEVLRGWAEQPGTAGNSGDAGGEAARVEIVLRFRARPQAIEVDAGGRVRGLVVERTSVDASGAVHGTGALDRIDADLVVRAIGYRGASIPGVPFDDATGTVPSEAGRVGPGEYTTGWVRRGPSGVIGTNRKCANETVASLLADVASGVLREGDRAGVDALRALGADPVSTSGWRAIDARERELGALRGAPRVTIEDRAALLAIARSV